MMAQNNPTSNSSMPNNFHATITKAFMKSIFLMLCCLHFKIMERGITLQPLITVLHSYNYV